MKIQALHRSQSYKTIDLDQDALRELNWWVASMASQNVRNILTQEPDLTMESNASLLGWGALCNGICNSGLWSPAERLAHINCLELTAAMFTVKALSRNKDSANVYLKLGNRTTVSYINHMRDSFSSVECVATQLWTWCLERGITLSAEHLPSDNCIADIESRTIQSSAEWQLSRTSSWT